MAFLFPVLSLGDHSASANSRLTPHQVLERLFQAQKVESTWFSPVFLSQVPIQQVQAIIVQLQQELGNYQGVEDINQQIFVQFERGKIPTQISLDSSGKIVGLFFAPPQSNAIAIQEAIVQLKRFPGQVSLLLLEDDQEIAALNADQPLAIASAFKLAVLAELQQQIATKKLAWTQVIPLQKQLKTLPSGILQTWPPDSHLTLESLASLMISLSDNTAADHLITLLGRDNIQQKSPRNTPFLTTREAFILKNPKNANLLKRYRQLSSSQRSQLLPEINQAELPSVNDFAGEPLATDIEWFFTPRELCQLMEQVKDLPLMGINSGVANPDDWQKIAFKGGSEPGVINLTTFLSKQGKTYTLSATWNHNQALDEKRFANLCQGIIQGLK